MPQGNDEMHEDDVDICVGDTLGDGEEEEINFVDDGSKLDEGSRRFDRIVGALEEVLMDPEFEEIRESFCRQNCGRFEAGDENKFEYTDIHKAYEKLVERTLERKLKQLVPGFSMTEFVKLVQTHKDSLGSEVFEFLIETSDFLAFKATMLDYKAEAARKTGGESFQIECRPMRVHTEEQEEGDSRPDLDLSLHISPVASGSKR